MPEVLLNELSGTEKHSVVTGCSEPSAPAAGVQVGQADWPDNV